MAVQLHFKVPFKDDLFYAFVVIILTVVGVKGRICAWFVCMWISSYFSFFFFCAFACVFLHVSVQRCKCAPARCGSSAMSSGV